MKEKHILAHMETAEVWAKCSPAERLQVGAVLVKNNRSISTGYNALPAHLNGPCEHQNEDGTLTTKHEVVHAEENALRGLFNSNETAGGAIIFITHAPCLNCASLIVDAGIVAVYYREVYRCTDGLDYLKKFGVETKKV